ncbi:MULTISPECIES: hypothetical protein [Lysinibacillus]|uniref:hypothetical protein n=1 Tax=Lysinibacillus TaxID=400634 RepID=UPI001586279F|nr:MULTISPECIES: hypothetical protein [Lysinibacillus]
MPLCFHTDVLLNFRFICAKAKRQQQMFSVAKAKRQLQSAQSERKSTSRFAEELYFIF